MRYWKLIESLIRVVGISLLIPVLTACASQTNERFAIYLVSGIEDPRVVDESEMEEIPLDDIPVISEEDILSYDLERHQMELTKEAYARIVNLFSLPVDVNGMPFVVVVGDDRIYSGAFYTPASSISYNGVVVMHPLGENTSTITFRLGYPSEEAFEGKDPRSDSRIKDRLEAVSKLK